MNKADTIAKYGAEQVEKWRRDPNEHPPAITKEDGRYPGYDLRYKDLTARELPLTENLSETMDRVFALLERNHCADYEKAPKGYHLRTW